MPALQCPSCGKVVRFEGSAGVCPHCAAMVRVAAPAAPTSARRPSQSTSSSKGSRSKSNLSDLEGLASGGEEVFAPSETPVSSGGTSNPFAGMDQRLIYAIGGGIALVVLFGLYIVLRPTTPDVAVIPSAPTANRPVAPPPAPTPVTPLEHPQPAPKPMVISTTNATSRPGWMSLVPVTPNLKAKAITDELVEKSIRQAVGYLKTQLSGNELTNPVDTERYEGTDALVVYSLLHASEAINDSELSISNPYMQGLLNRLRQYEMSKDLATYCRSLRASALAMFTRNEDLPQLQKDKEWLLKSEVKGAYDYTIPAAGADLTNHAWDNSNSQYGVLGIWAAIQAGESVPDKFWVDVEQHWLTCQNTDGGWAYRGAGDGSTLTMTCAGITTLCVTAEQQEIIASKGKKDARPQMSSAISKGLDWIGKENHLNSPNPAMPGYSLYGVERAALATGFRWFGDHDWYRELGAQQIQIQDKDGSWPNGGAGPAGETAFRVLFLSRGRQPLLMDKLRFDGDWNDRPRDVSKFTQFASAQLEKQFAWNVADLSRDWWDWLESPLLFISTDTPPDFSDEDCAKLRSYTQAGGMIFIHNEYGSKEVDAFVSSLAQRLYPQYPMTKVAPDNLLYSSVFPMKNKPALMSVSNGTRTLLVYSPKDITQDWVRFKQHDTRAKENPSLQMGLNLFVAAAGKTDFRNRLNSPYEEPCDFAAIGTVPVMQISYPGAWNPEPKAYERFGRWFQKQTSLKLDVQPCPILDLDAQQAPVAVLTGNADFDFGKLDLHALHEFVASGGVLVIDSTGGNKAFAAAIRQTLMPRAFPGVNPTGIPANHPILAGTGACMDAIPKPRLKNYASGILNGVAPNVEYATVDKGTVILSDLDITTGLLDSGTFGILGYTPTYDQSLMKNVILWALSRYHH
jgi:hypothetical protein